MKRIRFVSTGVLLLLLGTTAPFCAGQQDQNQQQDKGKQQQDQNKGQQQKAQQQQQEQGKQHQQKAQQQQQNQNKQQQQQRPATQQDQNNGATAARPATTTGPQQATATTARSNSSRTTTSNSNNARSNSSSKTGSTPSSRTRTNSSNNTLSGRTIGLHSKGNAWSKVSSGRCGRSIAHKTGNPNIGTGNNAAATTATAFPMTVIVSTLVRVTGSGSTDTRWSCMAGIHDSSTAAFGLVSWTHGLNIGQTIGMTTMMCTSFTPATAITCTTAGIPRIVSR